MILASLSVVCWVKEYTYLNKGIFSFDRREVFDECGQKFWDTREVMISSKKGCFDFYKFMNWGDVDVKCFIFSNFKNFEWIQQLKLIFFQLQQSSANNRYLGFYARQKT